MPVGFSTDEQSYYYKKNAQGDIIAILDSQGVELASYTYDAWGNVTAVSGDEDLAESNPFRYRGYYQDSESGFFYLQSRYYDSVVGRFLNSDAHEILSMMMSNVIGLNLFAYCYNNVVLYDDSTGYSVFPIAGPGAVYDSYQTAVSNWANRYASMSNGVEYGAMIYRFRVVFWTYYFIGETYKGFKTTDWYTVINGLAVGYLVGSAVSSVVNKFWPFTSLWMIGFAHTHPVGHSNNPSEPDKWMKKLGIFAGTWVFPIAVYNSSNKKTSINYF